MLKFLRQYNQWILVVGGTLLLITFLMPTAIQNCAQQSAVASSTWATYDGGKKVSGAELENAQFELRVVETMGNPAFRQIGIDRDPAHWWLAVHEAERAGFVGGLGDGEAVLRSIAAAQNLSPEQVLGSFMNRANATRDVVLSALAKAQGIQRMLSLAANVDRMSDLRLRQTVARSLLAMNGDLVVIDARSPSAAIAASPATDERLAEQLKKFAEKAAPPAPQVGRENFGYRIPDRVKLEWLQIPKSSVLAGVASSPELSTLALKKRFAQDPAKYGAQPGVPFASFEEAVRSKTLEELAAARLAEIGKFSSDQLALAQRTLRRSGVYFELPEDWTAKALSFAALAESISSEFGIATPVVQSSGPDWMVVADVVGIPGLGTASTDKFGTKVRTNALVAGAKELSEPKQSAPIQAGVASPALVADSGDLFFVRIVAAEASRPAAELAEVRAELERDVASLERFAWLEANVDSVMQMAVQEGLPAVATRFGTQVRPVVELSEANPQFLGFGMRLESPIPGLGNDSKALGALVEKAMRLPLTADVSTLPAAERTFAALSPDKLSLVVLQVNGVTPVTKERYDDLSGNPSILGVARDPALAIDPAALFGYDVLAKRYDFKPVRGEDAEVGDEPVAPESAG